MSSIKRIIDGKVREFDLSTSQGIIDAQQLLGHLVVAKLMEEKRLSEKRVFIVSGRQNGKVTAVRKE